MIEHVAHYQFGFFAPGTRVEPTPDIIAQLLDTFKDKGFIPTTVPELKLGPTTESRLQLQLTTKHSEWNLAFEPHRVLLMKQNVPDIDMGTPDNFTAEAKDVFSRLLPVIPLTGTRLSYVTKGLLPEMSSDDLKKVNSQLLKLPAFYSEYPPCEWTTRNVARCEINIRDKTETINVITDINRIQGSIKEKKGSQLFDRIEIGFDINTFQKNMIPRFGADDVCVFLKEAVAVSQRILNEIGDMINE